MKNYLLNNGTVISIDFENAAVKNVLYKEKDLVKGSVPFFAVKLRDKQGKATLVSASDCEFLSENDGIARYAHELFEIEISVKASDNSLVWRSNIVNKSDMLIEQVELMSIGVHGRLMDEQDGRGAIVFPWNEGALITSMEKRESLPFRYMEPEYPSLGRYAVFPNMISSQFLAYLCDGVGVYLGMHDSERTTKHIDFRYRGNEVKLQMRTFCDTDYGEDYKMPYDCVMTVFDGEWQDACELYREWFEENLPKDLVKIKDRSDLPEWYANSPIVVTYPVRGRFDTDVMKPNGLYPYKNAMPYLSEIAQKTSSQVMTLLMHWEGTAPWAPPFVWPPFGGEEQFSEFVDIVHKNDMLIGLYCSGMGWTQQSNLIEEYNCEKKFRELGINKIVCTDSDGSYRSEICKEQREGFDLCPANEQTKDILVNEAHKMIASGVDYIQLFDQNHGGCSYFCYSDKHGHIPAPGKWQQRHTNDLLEKIERKKVVLGCESAAAEPFLKNLNFSDNRYELSYYLGQAIPVYAYLYHEYVNNFMGNQICMFLLDDECNYTYRAAYSFAAGDMATVVLTDKGEVSLAWGNECFVRVDTKDVALTALKNFNAWRIGAGKEHLHKGRMVKPIFVCCGKKTFMGEDSVPIVVDEVLNAAYDFEGSVAQFCVNYNLTDVTVSTNEPVNVYLDPYDMSDHIKNVKTFTVPALSAVMIKKD